MGTKTNPQLLRTPINFLFLPNFVNRKYTFLVLNLLESTGAFSYGAPMLMGAQSQGRRRLGKRLSKPHAVPNFMETYYAFAKPVRVVPVVYLLLIRKDLTIRVSA
jgi:hypothetical protein